MIVIEKNDFINESRINGYFASLQSIIASASQAAAYLLELQLRQQMGAIPPKTLVRVFFFAPHNNVIDMI
jgi:hypothetical protein